MELLSVNEIVRKNQKGNLDVKNIAQRVINNRKANRHNKHIFQTFDPEEILRQTHKIMDCNPAHPLYGVPISVKDAYGVEGFPTYGGGVVELTEQWAHDSGIVGLFRNFGALFTGKTQMVEFALGGLGQNPNWGAPINPWDNESERVCGGSSCGAGASLWDGTAAVALAADIAGSVRVPASMTGTVGFRPSKGLWHFGDSYLGICPTFDSPGILTLSVEDAHLVFCAMSGVDCISKLETPDYPPTFADLKLGFSKSCFQKAQPDIRDAVWDALNKLSSAGAELIEASFPEFDAAYDLYMDSFIGAIECTAFVDRNFPNREVIKDPLISGRLEPARKISATAYLGWLNKRDQLITAAGPRMQQFDAFVTPTLPISPPRFDEIEVPDSYTRTNKMITLMTNPVNVLDLASITMPVGKDKLGLPVGLQLVAPSGSDFELLSIAGRAEKLIGKPVNVLGNPPRISR